VLMMSVYSSQAARALSSSDPESSDPPHPASSAAPRARARTGVARCRRMRVLLQTRVVGTLPHATDHPPAGAATTRHGTMVRTGRRGMDEQPWRDGTDRQEHIAHTVDTTTPNRRDP